MATRKGKHKHSTLGSEPAKDFCKNLQHRYNWTILVNGSKHTRTWKNLETIYIALLKPSLNDQSKYINYSPLKFA